MAGEVKGLENNIEIRMIFTDTKEEKIYPSIASVTRILGVTYKTINTAINPMNKKSFMLDGRKVVLRIKK